MPVQQAETPIRVGVLFSQSGVTAVVEQTQRNAVTMAIDEVNAAGGIDGRPIVAEYADPRSDPKKYREAAQAMVDAGIRILFGCYMSSTRKAVLPVVEQAGALLFYPTLYEGFEFSPNCFYGGASPNQNSIWLARYLMQTYGPDFYLIGSNYVFPYESNRIMRDFIETEGGRVHQERYVPLAPSDDDLARAIDEIARQPRVTVLSTVVGDGTARLYRAYREAGLDPDVTPIGSLTTGEPEVALMGGALAEGHYTAAPYFETVKTEANRAFLRRYRGRFGAHAPVSACTEAAYVQVHMMAIAARNASDNVDDLRTALGVTEFDAPQGRVRIDGDNHHTWLWPRIARADASGTFRIVSESRTALKPDPYLITPPSADWAPSATVA